MAGHALKKSLRAKNLVKKLVLDAIYSILQKERICLKEFREISFFYCVKITKLARKWRKKRVYNVNKEPKDLKPMQNVSTRWLL